MVAYAAAINYQFLKPIHRITWTVLMTYKNKSLEPSLYLTHAYTKKEYFAISKTHAIILSLPKYLIILFKLENRIFANLSNQSLLQPL
jgi:hypothetical protein